MAEFSVIYTEEALQDMLNISDYHFEKVGEASALRAVAELQDHIEKLSLFPRMGEEHPDTYLNALSTVRKPTYGWKKADGLSKQRSLPDNSPLPPLLPDS